MTIQMSDQFSIAIPHTWHYVRRLRDRMMENLADAPEWLRSAATMAAGELVENAVKYGEPTPGHDEIRFLMRMDPDLLTMEVSNGTRNAAGVKELIAHVATIQSTSDREALYLDRLRYLLEHPKETGKLGIYRIAYEGGFDVDVEHKDNVVVVRAKRRLP